MITDESVIEEFVDMATVNLDDDRHRKLGLWAFDTVNPNAWPGAEEVLESSTADFVAFQEAKVEAEEKQNKEAVAKGKGWKMSINTCLFGDGGGKSAGVAVGCRKHIGMDESFADEELPEELKGRFTVKRVGAVCKGGIHLASAYLHSSLGVKHKMNLDMLDAVAAVMSTLKGPWVLAADFQCTPAQLEATGWLKMVKGRIVAPNMPTCMGRAIDFFVVSEDMGGATVEAITIGDTLCKPHQGVRLYIKARPRTMMVRTLKKMGTLEAKLPFGPARKACYDDSGLSELELDEKYLLLLTRVESEVGELMGKEGKELEALMGRTSGPVFVQRCALGEVTGGTRKTSSTSRAWKKSAGWLGDILRTRGLVEEKVYKRKLLTYCHPPPDKYKATPQQLDSFAKFKVWQGSLTGNLLANRSWTVALKDMAVANAEKEEKVAQQIAMTKWMSWIREGPADGLRRQHKFTRSAAGWIPTEKSTGVVTGIDVRDELDDLQGVSKQAIDELNVQQAGNGAPATAQQEADQQADSWHKQWGAGCEIQEIRWPEHMGDDLPAILVEEM